MPVNDISMPKAKQPQKDAETTPLARIPARRPEPVRPSHISLELVRLLRRPPVVAQKRRGA